MHRRPRSSSKAGEWPSHPITTTTTNSSSPLQGSCGRSLWLPYSLSLRLCDVLPEPDTPTSSGTQNARIDQLDPRVLKSGNQLHERIYVAADDPVTGFHALDRRHREACQLRYLPLIDIQERTSGPELIGGDHKSAASDAIRI